MKIGVMDRLITAAYKREGVELVTAHERDD